jgi:hypothetical protein
MAILYIEYGGRRAHLNTPFQQSYLLRKIKLSIRSIDSEIMECFWLETSLLLSGDICYLKPVPARFHTGFNKLQGPSLRCPFNFDVAAAFSEIRFLSTIKSLKQLSAVLSETIPNGTLSVRPTMKSCVSLKNKSP